MASATEGELRSASPASMVVALLIAILIVVGAWKVIDYRSKPPPPPNPVGLPVNR